jgi:hypothetical protein
LRQLRTVSAMAGSTGLHTPYKLIGRNVVGKGRKPARAKARRDVLPGGFQLRIKSACRYRRSFTIVLANRVAATREPGMDINSMM